jgi:branched-chain amino acid aminotransferase
VVFAKAHALRNGCLEAVMLGNDGGVVGGTEGAFFLVRGGVVTPLISCPPDAVTQAVSEIVQEIGAQVPATTATVADMLAADEVFLAGTACGVIAIIRIDGRDIGQGTEGPVTRRVRERFRTVTSAIATPVAKRDTISVEGGQP